MGTVSVYDDYAHHPTAIQATLETFKEKFPDTKIWCVFQPHTYSRTSALLKEFGQAFKSADKVIITDIYSSEREKEGSVTGAQLADEIRKNQTNVRYIGDSQKIEKFIQDSIKGPAIVVTIGAGDVYKIGEDLLRAFKA